MQARSDQIAWRLNIKFEYTAKDTPQQNYLAELGFTTIAASASTMMTYADLIRESQLL